MKATPLPVICAMVIAAGIMLALLAVASQSPKALAASNPSGLEGNGDMPPPPPEWAGADAQDEPPRQGRHGAAEGYGPPPREDGYGSPEMGWGPPPRGDRYDDSGRGYGPPPRREAQNSGWGGARARDQRVAFDGPPPRGDRYDDSGRGYGPPPRREGRNSGWGDEGARNQRVAFDGPPPRDRGAYGPPPPPPGQGENNRWDSREACDGPPPPAGRDRGQVGGASLSPEDLFRALDGDGNGEVSLEEARRFFGGAPDGQRPGPEGERRPPR